MLMGIVSSPPLPLPPPSTVHPRPTSSLSAVVGVQIVVPRTFTEYTSRRVLTTSWLEGEKLSGSKAADVGDLVNLGVICYLKQLLDTGFFHVSLPLSPLACLTVSAGKEVREPSVSVQDQFKGLTCW